MQRYPNEPFPSDANGRRLCEIFGTYRWNPIEANAPESAAEKPQWRTLTQYPIRPRVLWERWQDAQQLVGVRFGPETQYALLDVDAGSPYCSPEGIANLRTALETLGVTRSLLVRSSHSGGVHLYLPLPEPVKTFDLAVALTGCLQAHGFQVKEGQLEVFPNVKAFGVQIFIEYKAHRLPLQPESGSYLLNGDWEPIPHGHQLSAFFARWDIAAQAQDMSLLTAALRAGRAQHRKRRRKPLDLSKVVTWRQDLEVEIAAGWTDYGQTNALLKSIACYGAVFEQLSGPSLVNYIERIATHCPGYRQYCRHQHQIRQRAIAWGRAAENYYWPLGSRPVAETVTEPAGPSWNGLRSQDAQQRIQTAITTLQTTGRLPSTVRGRVQALARLAKTSAATLYKHLSLWHPNYLPLNVESGGTSGVDAARPDPEKAVTVHPAEDSSHLTALSRTPAERENPLPNEVLQTTEKKMKGDLRAAQRDGLSENLFKVHRGVRGEETRFPQAQKADTSAIPGPELLDSLRQQIQRLGWNGQQIRRFIAAKFNGRQRRDLLDSELVTLLYFLQTEAHCLAPPDL